MSDLLSRIMDRYPIIVWAGAALIGKVGGEMMITDPWVHALLNPPKWVEYAVTVFFVVVVVAAGKLILNRNKRQQGAVNTRSHIGVPLEFPLAIKDCQAGSRGHSRISVRCGQIKTER